MMSWTALVVLLMVLGFFFLLVELAVIPGFGVMGVLGIAALVGATAVAWLKLGALHALAAFLAGGAAFVLLVWLFPKSRLGQASVLKEQQLGFRAGDPHLEGLVGKEGRTLTPLRPAGTAEIEGMTVDVVADGVYVESNTAVRVVTVEGGRVVVETVDRTDGGTK
ncbi:MAG: NfeD family protein [Pseudomonadota bacterium]